MSASTAPSSSSTTYVHSHERAVPHPKLAAGPGKTRSKSGAANAYLVLYNAVSAALWAAVLSQVVQTVALKGVENVFADAAELTKWVQTLAVLEIVHAAVGLVRTPLLTTLMQVASRFLLVWGIAEHFPSVVATNPAYTSMLVAWSVTEVIRYSYFAISLAAGSVPDAVTWLRYNTFFVLYPLGISSECWLVWSVIPAARARDYRLEYALWGVLAIYVPGSYILFTHMMAQRRKVLRALRAKKTA